MTYNFEPLRQNLTRSSGQWSSPAEFRFDSYGTLKLAEMQLKITVLTVCLLNERRELKFWHLISNILFVADHSVTGFNVT